jgi:CubicO group peptidase (beta-lactamase class C family)
MTAHGWDSFVQHYRELWKAYVHMPTMRTMLAFPFFILATLLANQTKPTGIAPQQIDELFAAYNRPQSPGCSVGVIRDGVFIFQKSYGEASLELNVRLTSKSVFYMASVSKQFTAASVVLAAEQGFLSLDDDVRKYIPELPDYGTRITLRQMLHQTSGFRDFLDLMYLAGRNISALSSPDDVLSLIARQKGWNNVPGEEFVYSNSNYFLLGMVVKRATGKSLAEFAATNIFQPLGMKHTFFYDDNGVVVPNRVAAYDPGKDGKFLVDWSTTYDIVGGGGLMSNVDDLLLWDGAFYSNKLGKGTLIRELETPGTLNNGEQINYGMGLWLSEYRGLKIVEHSGGTFGYRTELLRFPDQRFSVVALCNVGNADVEGLARKISDLYLEQQLKPEAANVDSKKNNETSFSPAELAGTYLDHRKHMIYTFTAVDGNLMAWGAKLRRLGASEFSDFVGNPIVFKRQNGTMTATLTLQGEIFFSGDRVAEIHLNEATLKASTGDYFSDELDTTYKLSLVKGVLSLQIGTQPAVSLNPVASNEFQAGEFGTIVFQGSGDHVSGLTFFSQRSRGISFRKLK